MHSEAYRYIWMRSRYQVLGTKHLHTYLHMYVHTVHTVHAAIVCKQYITRSAHTDTSEAENLHPNLIIWASYGLRAVRNHLHDFESDLEWVWQVRTSWTTTTKCKCLSTGLAWVVAVSFVFEIRFVSLSLCRLDANLPPCIFRTALQ